MSASVYRKDKSPGKMMARATAYAYAFRHRAKFRKGIHLVISSRRCGDIHYLMDMGVDRANILACDIDKEAVLSSLFLGVDSYQESIASLVSRAIRQYGQRGIASINVDLCSTLKRGVSILMEVLSQGVLSDTPVFFTYRRGRRDPFAPSPITDDKRRAFLEASLARLPKFRKKIVSITHYTSSTCSSRGSAMAMAILQ